MRYLASLIFGVLLVGCNTANIRNSTEEEPPDEMSFAEFCESNPCRENIELSFLTDNGRVEQFLEWYWPVVQGDQISLLPGDKIYIEAILEDEKFINLKQVQINSNPEKTIIFNFQQMDGKIDMILSVKNPFSELMKFNLNMIDFEGNPHKTSSCPVVSGGSVYEMWPHIIPELIVSNIHLLSEAEAISCEY